MRIEDLKEKTKEAEDLTDHQTEQEDKYDERLRRMHEELKARFNHTLNFWRWNNDFNPDKRKKTSVLNSANEQLKNSRVRLTRWRRRSMQRNWRLDLSHSSLIRLYVTWWLCRKCNLLGCFPLLYSISFTTTLLSFLYLFSIPFGHSLLLRPFLPIVDLMLTIQLSRNFLFFLFSFLFSIFPFLHLYFLSSFQNHNKIRQF